MACVRFTMKCGHLLLAPGLFISCAPSLSMSGQEAEAALAAAQDARACELAEMQARLEQAAQAAAEDLDAAALDRSRLLGRRAGQMPFFCCRKDRSNLIGLVILTVFRVLRLWRTWTPRARPLAPSGQARRTDVF